MTETPYPAIVPVLLDSMRRTATQLLEQTADVERWLAERRATYEQIEERSVTTMCECDPSRPALCDQHATIMVMAGGPLDGHIEYWRLAGKPLERIALLLPRPEMLFPCAGLLDDVQPLPRAEYVRRRQLLAGSRVYEYRLLYCDDALRVSRGPKEAVAS